MIDLSDINYVRGLKSNLHVTFESPHGKEVMKFIEQIGGWMPTIADSMETNAIVARDANRKLIGTIKTMLELTPEQIVSIVQKEN